MQIISRIAKEKGLLRQPIDPDFFALSGLTNENVSANEATLPNSPWERRFRIIFNKGKWDNCVSAGLLILRGSGPVDMQGAMAFSGTQLLIGGGRSDDIFSKKFVGQPAVERIDFEAVYDAGSLSHCKTTSMVIPYHGNDKGVPLASTRMARNCSIEDGVIREQTGRFRALRRLDDKTPLWSDWDLPLRCSTWNFAASVDHASSLFEELSIQRVNGKLSYRGASESQFYGKVHSFVYKAQGVLPIDIWVDDEHRLIGIMSGSFAEALIPEEWVTFPLYDPLVDEMQITSRG